MDVLLGTALFASFLGGVVALLAPCCVSVMLPAYFASTFRRRSATEFRVERSVPIAKSALLPDKAVACAPTRLVVSQRGDLP